MIHSYLKPALHYVAIGLLLVVVYFVASGLLDKYHADTLPVPQVVAVQPAPQGAVNRTAQALADAANSSAMSAALQGEALQLSSTAKTIANAASVYTGVDARMAGALATGLVQGAPQRQVVAVTSKADPKATFTVPTPGPNDDQIKRDMEEVLAASTVNSKVNTNVNVGWEAKPFSAFSAVYASDGSSGAAVRLIHRNLLNLNALALVNKGKPEVGANLEYVLKNTSAGVGIGGAYNFGTHNASVLGTVQVHM